MPDWTPEKPLVVNVFWTPESVVAFHVMRDPTLTMYLPASLKLYSRNGSLAIDVPVFVVVHVFWFVNVGCVKHVLVLPRSSVEPHFFVLMSTVHVTSARRVCTCVSGSSYQSSNSGTAW